MSRPSALLFALPLLAAACDAFVSDTVRSHPCVGNRTDVVWADDPETFWVGCGSTTQGTGLYTSSNAGRTWQSVAGFEDFRVSHVHRAPDGVLYAAGTEVGGGGRVRTADGTDVLTSDDGLSWHVGSFVQLDDGLELAESLTGSDLLWRPDGGSDWQDGRGFDDGSSPQLLDVVAFDGGVVGVGSTITEPPSIYVQDRTDAGSLTMVPVLPEPEVRGEIWAVDADGSGIVAGGVDQDASAGRVYTFDAGGDVTSAASWNILDVAEALPGDTWIRGVCREGDFVVAVGEDPVTEDGILLLSGDGGATWTGEEPAGAPPLTACDVVDGEIVMAGANGWIAIR